MPKESYDVLMLDAPPAGVQVWDNGGTGQPYFVGQGSDEVLCPNCATVLMVGVDQAMSEAVNGTVLRCKCGKYCVV